MRVIFIPADGREKQTWVANIEAETIQHRGQVIERNAFRVAADIASRYQDQLAPGAGNMGIDEDE